MIAEVEAGGSRPLTIQEVGQLHARRILEARPIATRNSFDAFDDSDSEEEELFEELIEEVPDISDEEFLEELDEEVPEMLNFPDNSDGEEEEAELLESPPGLASLCGTWERIEPDDSVTSGILALIRELEEWGQLDGDEEEKRNSVI